MNAPEYYSFDTFTHDRMAKPFSLALFLEALVSQGYVWPFFTYGSYLLEG